MKFRFDCIFYYCSNLDRSIRFYTEVLGFKFLSRDMVARFDVDGVRFEIVPGLQSDQFTQPGNARLGLRVDDVAAALQELKTKAVRVNPVHEKGVGVLGTLYDPDGNEICLWQYAGSVATSG